LNSNLVTLIVVEGKKDRHDSTRLVFEKMSKIMEWHDVKYLSLDMTYKEAIKFEIGGHLNFLPNGSSHALVCTWDGFIINPHLWTDKWLEYDMIGSPWPKSWNTGNQVGNMGLCLMSRRFMEMAQKYMNLYDGCPSDVFLCQKMYSKFTEEGIKYAPVELAARFGWEYDIEGGFAGPEKSFGFHGWVNGKNQKEYYERLSSLAR